MYSKLYNHCWDIFRVQQQLNTEYDLDVFPISADVSAGGTCCIVAVYSTNVRNASAGGTCCIVAVYSTNVMRLLVARAV